MLEIGANVGYYSIMYSHLVGSQGKVLAVEASPRTHELLSTSLEFNGLSGIAEVKNLAVTDQDDKTVNFRVSRSRPLNNQILASGSSEVASSICGG